MISIKRVDQNHAPEVARLINAGGEVKTKYTPNKVTKQRHYVAIKNNKIAGCIGLCGLSYYMDEIQHIRVKPEFRRNDVGSYLVKEVIKKSPKPLLISVIKKDNLPSIKLHRKIGFKRIIDFQNTYGNEADIFLFRK